MQVGQRHRKSLSMWKWAAESVLEVTPEIHGVFAGMLKTEEAPNQNM